MYDFSKIVVKINLLRIAQNFQIVKNMLSHNTHIGVAVKADGYGLGALRITKKLSEIGCNNFFVATLDEALELRGDKDLSGVNIYALHGVCDAEEAKFCHDFNVTPILSTVPQIEIFDHYARSVDSKFKAALHIDTGLNRLGLPINDLKKLTENLPQNIKFEYVMSHLACAEDAENPRNAEQLSLFREYTKCFRDAKFSLANSSGIFLGADYHFDLVRPGCAIYGINPIAESVNPMYSVVNMSAAILQKNILEKDGYIGYKTTHFAKLGTKCFVVACGYADGYNRQLSNLGFCYVAGYYLPVIGLISMDLTVFDASALPDDIFYSAEYVELLGENIKIDDVAQYANTIAYEIITTKFGKRCKRIYVDHDE